jgi:hypothetical protein
VISRLWPLSLDSQNPINGPQIGISNRVSEEMLQRLEEKLTGYRREPPTVGGRSAPERMDGDGQPPTSMVDV